MVWVRSIFFIIVLAGGCQEKDSSSGGEQRGQTQDATRAEGVRITDHLVDSCRGRVRSYWIPRHKMSKPQMDGLAKITPVTGFAGLKQNSIEIEVNVEGNRRTYIGYFKDDAEPHESFADPQSLRRYFEIVRPKPIGASFYGKNDSFIYYDEDRILADAIYDRFRMIDKEYATDGVTVWHKGQVVEGADPTTFKGIGQSYGTDQNKAYFGHTALGDADPSALKVWPLGYATDGNYVFFKGTVVGSSSDQSFEYLDHGFARTSTQVWVDGKEIFGSLASSFKVKGCKLRSELGLTCTTKRGRPLVCFAEDDQQSYTVDEKGEVESSPRS